MWKFDRLYPALNAPLTLRSRVALALLTLALACTLALPLWRIEMAAPQYPDGLTIEIFSYTVRGDVDEINTLNHYIGMKQVDQVALLDLGWIPLVLGFLALFALRTAAIGGLTATLDLLVLFTYFSLFSFGRFIYTLWVLGHHLDPAAPFKLEPFMPPVLGVKTVANFTIASWPAGGSLMLAIFGVGVAWVFASNLLAQLRTPPR